MAIGEKSDTATEVIQSARDEITRTGGDGSGHNGKPYWMPTSQWREPNGVVAGGNWPVAWNRVTERSHIDSYRFNSAVFREQSYDIIDAPGGPVYVRPHYRDGHPVRGYSRSAPGR